MAAVNLSSGAIAKIMTGECTENDDLKPVLQLTDTHSGAPSLRNGKRWYLVGLSDGSFMQIGVIDAEIFISNKLQEGSILQLTKFRLIKDERYLRVRDLNLLCRKCHLIGDPELLDDEIMGFDLTPGAITKIVAGKCTSNDLRPALQLIGIDNGLNSVVRRVGFSDGSFMQFGFIVAEIFISNKLQEGSIVQLTEFKTIDHHNRKGEIDFKRLNLFLEESRDDEYVKRFMEWTLPAFNREGGVGEGWKGFVYALEGVYDNEAALQKIRSLSGHDDRNSLSNLLWWIFSRGDSEDGSARHCWFGDYCH